MRAQPVFPDHENLVTSPAPVTVPDVPNPSGDPRFGESEGDWDDCGDRAED